MEAAVAVHEVQEAESLFSLSEVLLGIDELEVVEDGLQEIVVGLELLDDLGLVQLFLLCHLLGVLVDYALQNLNALEGRLVLLDALDAVDEHFHPLLLETPVPHYFTELVQGKFSYLFAVLLGVRKDVPKHVSRLH